MLKMNERVTGYLSFQATQWCQCCFKAAIPAHDRETTSSAELHLWGLIKNRCHFKRDHFIPPNMCIANTAGAPRSDKKSLNATAPYSMMICGQGRVLRAALVLQIYKCFLLKLTSVQLVQAQHTDSTPEKTEVWLSVVLCKSGQNN